MKRYKLLKDLPGFPAGAILRTKGDEGSAAQRLYTESGGILSGYELRDSLIYVGTGVGAGPITNWLEELPNNYTEADDGLDNDAYAIGNYFKTPEKAELVVDYLKALAVVRDDAKGFVPDWKDGSQKWCVTAYHDEDGSCVIESEFYSRTLYNGVFGLPYFKSEEDAEVSIKKHRKEWETIFGVKDETGGDDE